MRTPQITYAIGDVHGEAERLKEMHALILERHRLQYSALQLQIIHLGDYVDRGPDSRGVIDRIHTLARRPDLSVISLAGNHEELMVKALVAGAGKSYDLWMENGGEATLKSYRNAGLRSVPISHIGWLMSRPRVYSDPHEKRIFVHAGVDPEDFPSANETTYLWTRSRQFFDVREWAGTALEGWTVVHGHTPTDDFEPDLQSEFGTRVNVDTGAVYGGPLTCAILNGAQHLGFLQC